MGCNCQKAIYGARLFQAIWRPCSLAVLARLASVGAPQSVAAPQACTHCALGFPQISTSVSLRDSYHKISKDLFSLCFRPVLRHHDQDTQTETVIKEMVAGILTDEKIEEGDI